MLSDCLPLLCVCRVLDVRNVGVLWPNVAPQKWAPSLLKKGQSLQFSALSIVFSAHVYCGQTAGWMKMPPGTDVGLGPSDIVLGGDPVRSPSPKKGAHPQFSAHVYWGQTAVCIRMPFGTEVGLSLGDIVLDGDPAPPP